MIKKIVLLFIVSIIVSSCSSDKGEDLERNTDNAFSLIGEWVFKEIDVSGAATNINLAKSVLDRLVKEGCDVAVFTFKESTVITSIRDYTETGFDVKPDGSGLLVECPKGIETTVTTWELEDDKLSFVDDNSSEKTIIIALTEDTLVIPAEFIDKDNLKGVKAIFKRK